MKIIGLDVGRGSVVFCCLTDLPDNLQQHYRHMMRSHFFHHVKSNRFGVELLLDYKPDAIILEPTGHWYAHFWVTVAKKNEIEIFWVGNSDLDKLRGSYGFVNKRDSSDAFTLACSYFDPRFINRDGSKRFLKFYYNNSLSIARIRELFLEKEQLQKIRMQMISQLRQRLAVEYPEAVTSTITISQKRGFSPFIGWLANKQSSTYHQNKYRQSIARCIGVEISDYTLAHAEMIYSLETRIVDYYSCFENLLDEPQWQPYVKVFDRFGFGINLKILLLYYCYPFDKFLIDGKPWIEREPTVAGKMQKRDRSLRKFQSYLGMGYSFKQSGELNKSKFAGSSMMRSHLYIWAVCRIASTRGRHRSAEITRIAKRYDELRKTIKGKDALIRILFLTTRHLYRELLNSINS